MLFNALNTPRYVQALRRLYGMIAQPSAPTLSNEVQPGVDIFARPEFWALFDGAGFIASLACAAGAAGVFSGVGIRNPTGSALIVVVEGWNISSSADAVKLYFRRAAANASSLVASATTFSRDGRVTGFTGGCPVLIQSQQTNNLGAAGYVGSVFGQMPQDVTQLLPVVLSPGTELQIFHGTAATAVAVSYFGYYRPATDAELSLG